MHHLQIMESLGGDSLWLDRFMAQHGAIVYYWVLIGARLSDRFTWALAHAVRLAASEDATVLNLKCFLRPLGTRDALAFGLTSDKPGP